MVVFLIKIFLIYNMHTYKLHHGRHKTDKQPPTPISPPHRICRQIIHYSSAFTLSATPTKTFKFFCFVLRDLGTDCSMLRIFKKASNHCCLWRDYGACQRKRNLFFLASIRPANHSWWKKALIKNHHLISEPVGRMVQYIPWSLTDSLRTKHSIGGLSCFHQK